MALWGNNDNLNSTGTVSVNYANRTVTGTGTTFGAGDATGAGHTEAQVGDVIRFGSAFGGAENYHGEAVIVGIASTTHLTINSTAGLSGQEITASQFQITTLPKWCSTDAAQNQSSGRFDDPDRLKLTTETSARIGIGTTIITITGDAGGNNVGAVADADTVFVGKEAGHLIQGHKIHSATSTAGSPGVSTIFINAPGLDVTTLTYRHVFAGGSAAGTDTVSVRESHGHDVSLITVGDTFVHSSDRIGIGTIRKGVFANEKRLILDLPLGVAVAAGANVDIEYGARSGTPVTVNGAETLGGKESNVVGVSTAGVQASATTQFETGAGWVGVTTYKDQDGNLRVKKEILVAMSGIQTGNTPIYDGDPFN